MGREVQALLTWVLCIVLGAVCSGWIGVGEVICSLIIFISLKYGEADDLIYFGRIVLLILIAMIALR